MENNIGRIITKDSRYNHELIEKIYTESVSKGIYIDTEIAEQIYESLINESLDYEEKALRDLPVQYHEANLNSPKQVKEILTEHFDFENFASKTKTGGLSFGEEVLAAIYETTGNMFAYNLREHRSKKSIASKIKEVLGYLDQDDMVHPQFVFGETNRISYKEPGLSNLNESCRPMIAAGKDRKLIKADYKAQEIYIQLNMLDIPELKKVFDESPDFYAGMVKELAGFDLTTKLEYRPNIKTAWIAGIYNSSLRGLGSNKEEKDLVKKIKEKVHSIPQIEKFREHVANQLAEGDRTVESYFGTERQLPPWVKHKNQLQNVAFNNTFQITGADILFFALENCYNAFNDLIGKTIEGSNETITIEKDDIFIYMTIHDEIIFNVSDKLLNNAKELVLQTIEDSMVLNIEGWTKLKIDLEISDTY